MYRYPSYLTLEMLENSIDPLPKSIESQQQYELGYTNRASAHFIPKD